MAMKNWQAWNGGGEEGERRKRGTGERGEGGHRDDDSNRTLRDSSSKLLKGLFGCI